MRLILAVCAGLLGVFSAAQSPDLESVRNKLIQDLIVELRKGEWQGMCGTYDPGGRWASENLIRIGEPAVPELIKGLGSEDVWVRYSSASCLGRLNVRSAAPQLKRAYYSETNELARQGLLAALSALDGPGTFDILVSSLPDDGDKLGPALFALGETKDARAIPMLAEYLNGKRCSGQERSAAYALVSLGTPAIGVLGAALSGPKPTAEAAAAVIGDSEDVGAVPFIVQVLRSPQLYKLCHLQHRTQPEISQILWHMLEYGSREERDYAIDQLRYGCAKDDFARVKAFLAGCLKWEAGAREDDLYKDIVAAAEMLHDIDAKMAKAPIRQAYMWARSVHLYEASKMPSLVNLITDESDSTDSTLLLELAQARTRIKDDDDTIGFFQGYTEDIAAKGCANLGPVLMARLGELWKVGRVSDEAFSCAISEIQEGRYFDMVLAASKSQTEPLRDAAIMAFGQIGGARCEAALQALAKNPATQKAATNALADLGSEMAIRSLIKQPDFVLRTEILPKLREPFLKELLNVGGVTTLNVLGELKRRGQALPRGEAVKLISTLSAEQDSRWYYLQLSADDVEFNTELLHAKDIHIRSMAYFNLLGHVKSKS